MTKSVGYNKYVHLPNLAETSKVIISTNRI